jgi:selenocysteine lyase/cysteine desulfurase
MRVAAAVTGSEASVIDTEAPFDVERARRETPGVEGVIHLNNAGAALMPGVVLTAMVEHLEREAAIGGYEAAAEAATEVNRVYGAIARLLNCAPDEVAVVENATRAWDMAFYAIPFEPGDRILSSAAEYESNYVAFLQVCRRTGARVEIVPSDPTGQVSVEALEAMIDDRVRLISLTHVPTNGGLVNPAAAVGQIARRHGIPYLLDACQAAGQLPLDVEEIGCDILSATGRKYLRGPRGTGFLYVRRSLIERLEPPFLDLHAAEWVAREEYLVRPDARRFENWETNYAAKIGLGVAVDYALGWGSAAVWDRVRSLGQALRDRLADLPNVTVRDVGAVKCGIVSLVCDGLDGAEVQGRLRADRINVSVSPRRYTRIDMEDRGLAEVVRASVHYYNTESELDALTERLARMR